MKFNSNYHIDVSNVKLTELVKQAYNLSQPVGMGFLHFQPGDMTDSDAEKLVKPESSMPVSLDYIGGRQCKFHVRKTECGKLVIDNRWYDHSQQQLSQLLKNVGIEAVLPD